MNRFSPLAAAAVIIAALVVFSTPSAKQKAQANVIMAPEGGRLDALDAQGSVLGPCPLKHTDVDVAISGWFARVTLRQEFHSPYRDKIEAVYTFPLSHQGAVDRMTMTVGDRVIVGEVQERQRARAVYEAAKQSGHVASLLEQERPNIFTQSVANIEPGEDVIIEISYVELLESKEGVFSFDFPMVVGPRYIPGSPAGTGAAEASATPGSPLLPAGLEERYGLVLLAPAELTVGQAGKTDDLGTLDNDRLQQLFDRARPILQPDDAWWTQLTGENAPQVWYQFQARYPGVTQEQGVLYTNGVGQVSGRWFCFQAKTTDPTGEGFNANTDQVPDASRITPMPTKPPTRAGHDISLSVEIDSGGPGIAELKSALHEIDVGEQLVRSDGRPRKVKLQLAEANEIPNRDFILTWREVADTITESFFTHTGAHGNFFTLILQPPDRVADAAAVPRELVFVLDTSGSMTGLPIDKAKECMAKAMNGLRPQDTFNLITFSGDTSILWDQPRPGTWENIAEAQNFLASREGGGGTEMMTAINTALVRTKTGPLTPKQLANLPADGRTVQVLVTPGQLGLEFRKDLQREVTAIAVREGLSLRVDNLGAVTAADGMHMQIDGTWQTVDGERVLEATSCAAVRPPAEPLRIVCFMTDGYVGNDMAIIDAIRNNAHTTRVFSFGIGDSVNRYLLDGMAEAGRGAADYVPLNDQADAVAERFLKRIQTPVLTGIDLEFSEGLHVTDLLPELVSDLWDKAPIIIHGRYTEPGSGTLTIRGNAGDGPYERVLDLEFPEDQPEHDTIATLWARTKVDQIMYRDLAAAQEGRFPPELRQEVVDLGEEFGIMTQFTSFVAVEKLRVTIGGQPRLVAVPIELPEGVSYEGNFGERLCKWGQCIARMKSSPRYAPRNTNRSAGESEATADSARTMVFPLAHASAADASEQLSRMLSRAAQTGGLSGVKMDLGGVAVDPQTNSLIVTGGPVTYSLIDSVLQELDNQTKLAPDEDRSMVGSGYYSANDTSGNEIISSIGTQAPIATYAYDVLSPCDQSETVGGTGGDSVLFFDIRPGPDSRITPVLTPPAEEPDAAQKAAIGAQGAEIAQGVEYRLANTDETKSQRIDQLLQRANELRKEKRLDDAVEVLNQALVINPKHSEANLHKDILEDLASHIRDIQAVGERREQAQDLFVESDETGIPWHQDMIYPKNWPEVSARRGGSVVGGQETQATVEARKKLEQPAPNLNYHARPLEEVVGDLRKLTGARDVDLGYTIDEGVVQFSTKENINHKTVLRVYNVKDLLTSVPFYHSNQMGLDDTRQGGQKAGGSGDGVTILPMPPGRDLGELASNIEDVINQSEDDKKELDRDYQPSKVKIVPDASSGTLMVAANPGQTEEVKRLAEELQARGPAGGRMRVMIPLQNLSPEKAKQLIEQLRQSSWGKLASEASLSARWACGEPGSVAAANGLLDALSGRDFLGYDPKSPSAITEASSRAGGSTVPTAVVSSGYRDIPVVNDISATAACVPEADLDLDGLSDYSMADQDAASSIGFDSGSGYVAYGSGEVGESTGMMGPPQPADLPPGLHVRASVSRAALTRDRLRQSIASMSFIDSPLDEALGFLGEWCHVPMVVNWPVLERLGVERRACVALKLEGATIAELVEGVLGQFPQAELGYALTTDGCIYVSARQDLAYRRLMGLSRALGCYVLPSAMLPEQIAVQIARLYEEGDAAAAEWLAAALVKWAPKFETGFKMYCVLAATPLIDDGRAPIIAELRTQAAAAIDAFAADMQIIARRVDEKLLALIAGDGSETVHAGLTFDNDKVVVKVLTTHRDDAVLETLKTAGLQICSAVKSTDVIVGSIPPAKLAALALVDGVRRIEPVEEATASTAR